MDEPDLDIETYWLVIADRNHEPIATFFRKRNIPRGDQNVFAADAYIETITLSFSESSALFMSLNNDKVVVR